MAFGAARDLRLTLWGMARSHLTLAALATSAVAGLDVAAARAVHDRLLDLRADGAGIILISEDLDEILQLSDRITVLFEGTVRGVWSRDQADRSSIGAAMGGHLLDVA